MIYETNIMTVMISMDHSWDFWCWALSNCFVCELGISAEREEAPRGCEPLMTLELDIASYCHKSSHANTPLPPSSIPTSHLAYCCQNVTRYWMSYKNKLIFVLMGILLRPGSQLYSDDRDTQNIDTMIIIVININGLWVFSLKSRVCVPY